MLIQKKHTCVQPQTGKNSYTLEREKQTELRDSMSMLTHNSMSQREPKSQRVKERSKYKDDWQSMNGKKTKAFLLSLT